MIDSSVKAQPTNIDKYEDTWRPDFREDRVKEAPEHLARLFGNEFPKDANIVEVGSGSGAVTGALKEKFEGAKIICIDRDQRAEAAARANEVDFVLEDIVKMDEEKAKEMFEGADEVVALRTSMDVIDYLLKKLPEWGFKGKFAFSYINRTEEEARVVKLRDDLINKRHLMPKGLVASRAFGEIGFVVPFAPVRG